MLKKGHLDCHPERSEGSFAFRSGKENAEILRGVYPEQSRRAQNDNSDFLGDCRDSTFAVSARAWQFTSDKPTMLAHFAKGAKYAPPAEAFLRHPCWG
jgi:hypothetical protein